MIEICNLFKQYDHQPLFKGLHLDVPKGSVVTLIGPSGSGKSTLLRCINGLETFQEGHVSVNGQILYGINEQNYDKAQKDASTHVIFLEKGEIVEYGSPRDIFYTPKNDRTRAFLSRSMK